MFISSFCKFSCTALHLCPRHSGLRKRNESEFFCVEGLSSIPQHTSKLFQACFLLLQQQQQLYERKSHAKLRCGIFLAGFLITYA